MNDTIGSELLEKIGTLISVIRDVNTKKATVGKIDEDTGNTIYDVPGNPGYTYVTYDSGTVGTALNVGRGSIGRLRVPVKIEKGPDGPEIAGLHKRRAIETLDTHTVDMLGEGKHSHEPGFGMEDMVSNRRIVDGLVWYRGTSFGDAPLAIYVNPFHYRLNGIDKYWPGGSLDLTSNVPGTAGIQHFVKITFDPILGVLNATNGADNPDLAILTQNDLAAINVLHQYSLGGVAVANGVTDLSTSLILDCRDWNGDLGLGTPGTTIVGNIVLWNDVTGTLFSDSGVAISTDGTLAANSDHLIPTQKAIKTYVGSVVGGLYYQTVRDNGTDQTQRGKLNFIPGTGIAFTFADNPGADSTDLTVAASSGSGSPLTTPGDIYVFGSTNTRQPVGGNHAVLMVDTAQTAKLAYSDSETSAILLPVGTTGQEPAGANGLIRFNSTTSRKEWWENSAWQSAVRLSGDTMTGNLTAPGGLFTELGVGNAAVLNANAPLSLTHSVTDISATLNGVLSTVTHTMTANNNFSVRGFHSILTINNGGFNVTDDISSINYNIETDINGSGTVSSIAGVNIGHHISAATITTAYGLFMSSPTLTSGAAIITSYGIYLSAVTNGTNNWAIYTNGGKHYFSDTLQLVPPAQSVNQGFGFGLSVTHNTAVSAVYGSEVSAIASHTSGTMANLYGNFTQVFYAGTSAASPAITNLYGTYTRVGISGVSPTGTVTNAAGFTIDQISGQATGSPAVTVTNNYGLLVGDMGATPSGVTITNAKAIEVANQTGSGYAIHTNKGHVGFGADVTIIGSIDTIQLRVAGFSTQTNDIFRVDNSSFTKLATVSNTGLVSHFGRDSATNTVSNVVIASHDSSGTPAANFGTGIVIQGQDSTTADQQMARWRSYWSTATHASRATITIFSSSDNIAERDVIGIGADGSAALLGFYPTVAAAPIAQPTTAIAASTFVANTSGIANDTATWDGYTIGQVVKALRNLGLLA